MTSPRTIVLDLERHEAVALRDGLLRRLKTDGAKLFALVTVGPDIGAIQGVVDEAAAIGPTLMEIGNEIPVSGTPTSCDALVLADVICAELASAAGRRSLLLRPWLSIARKAEAAGVEIVTAGESPQTQAA